MKTFILVAAAAVGLVSAAPSGPQLHDYAEVVAGIKAPAGAETVKINGEERVVLQWDEAIEQSRLCFVSRFGSNVRAYDAACPEKTEIDEQERRFLSRMGADSMDLFGSVAVFVGDNYILAAGSYLILGINPDRNTTVTLMDNLEAIDGSANWRATYSHELSHLLLRRHKEFVGLTHYAYDACPTAWRPDWEACELLDAAQAWYTSQLSLSPDNRFVKLFGGKAE